MVDQDFDYATFSLARVKPLCAEAIKTMRNAIDDAERVVNRESTTPEQAIMGVLKVSWGWANASSSLASAISAIEDVRKVAMSEESA